MKFVIQPEETGQRLDHFLVKKLNDQTRSQLKKIIEGGLVLINDKPTKVHHFLKNGDIVSVEIKNPPTPLPPYQSTTLLPYFPTPLPPKIIFENNDFLVVDKPVGLLVHPTEKGEKDTLVDWVAKRYPEIKKIGDENYRGGIIHRLDRDVSGVMMIAKTNEAYRHLKDQFKSRLVKKEYVALVYGKIEDFQGEINLPIGRNQEGQFVAHPRQGTRIVKARDKTAKTKYEVTEYVKDYTLLKVNILTGRTHQIRAHFFAIGHPILGDKIYKPRKKFFHFLRRKIKVIDPGRIFLHSAKIGFNDLTNQWQEFSSPLPKQLTEFLNACRKK
ncbi:MAG: RluA family pseudouridine synthase [Patescibacteria group bacterium]|jgi:23S rRNA pseudouridine1911/1915/1917 synthase